MKLPTTKRDAPAAVWRRMGLAIRPANDIAEAMLRGLKIDEEFVGYFRRPRSLKQLKLWWSLMKLLVDHDQFPSLEAASDATKVAIGHCEVIIFPDSGEVLMIPRSISFSALRQDEFNLLFESALTVITERWIRGVGSDALRSEAWNMIDGPGRVGDRVT
jgi:hypothetical protein